MNRLARALPLIAATLALGALVSSPACAFRPSIDECTLVPAKASELSGIAGVPERSMLEQMRMQQESGLTISKRTADPATSLAPERPPICAWHEPAQPLAAATATPSRMPADRLLPLPDRPDIFGSLALRVSHTALDTKWHIAYRSELPKTRGPWASLIRALPGQEKVAQLRAVNRWVNERTRFTYDRTGNVSTDRWSNARTTLLRARGDCEDYAIAKMKLLEAAGFDRGSLYLVVARDLVRRADHALLVVRIDQQLFVLDGGTNAVLDAKNVTDYRPILSLGAEQSWVYGYSAS